MKRFVFAAILAIVLPPPSTLAAPKAESPRECAWYWDIAITARAQAMEGVERETARRAIWRVFTTPIPRMRDIGNLVVDTVYSTPWSAEEPAGALAQTIQDACMANGDMDSVLGTSL